MNPLCVGSPQVPLSYTQMCTSYAFDSPQRPLVCANMYPYAFGSPQVPLSYTQTCTPMRLVHLRYHFRIPKYVPPMRLVHLRYLFRIPKYVPPMRLVR